MTVGAGAGADSFSCVAASCAAASEAVSNALKKAHGLEFHLTTYQEHALTKSTSSEAIAYVGIEDKNGNASWGAAVDPDIIRASIDALITAINIQESR